MLTTTTTANNLESTGAAFATELVDLEQEREYLSRTYLANAVFLRLH